VRIAVAVLKRVGGGAEMLHLLAIGRARVRARIRARR
jgi:hypothetical protein